MIVAIALLVYAVVLLAAGVPALARARWPDRAPRLAVFAWLGTTGTAAASIALSGLALAVPQVRITASLMRLISASAIALRTQFLDPDDHVLAVAGSLFGVAVLGRVCWCTARTMALARLARRRYRRGLAMAGRVDDKLGAIIVDHDEPAAWCLPGGGAPVVLTSSALETLDAEHLAAVLAHERAHQRGRHHVLVGIAGSLSAAFPRLSAFRRTHEHVAWFVELLADDAAAATCSRLTVAEAILALGAASPEPAVLHASTHYTAARVRRLLAAPPALRRPVAIAGMLAIAALGALPLAVLAAPTVAVIGPARSPVPGQHVRASTRHVGPGSRSHARQPAEDE
jgi:Zn-dependent protease with chaperone function